MNFDFKIKIIDLKYNLFGDLYIFQMIFYINKNKILIQNSIYYSKFNKLSIVIFLQEVNNELWTIIQIEKEIIL